MHDLQLGEDLFNCLISCSPAGMMLSETFQWLITVFTRTILMGWKINRENLSCFIFSH